MANERYTLFKLYLWVVEKVSVTIAMYYTDRVDEWEKKQKPCNFQWALEIVEQFYFSFPDSSMYFQIPWVFQVNNIPPPLKVDR